MVKSPPEKPPILPLVCALGKVRPRHQLVDQWTAGVVVMIPQKGVHRRTPRRQSGNVETRLTTTAACHP